MNMLSIPPAAVPAAQGLTKEDFKRIQGFLDHSVSASTLAMYRSVWTTFEDWTSARAVLGLPVSPTPVAAYLSHLADERRLSVSTIRVHRAALAAINRATGHQDPTDNEGVRRLMQGISRAHGRAQRQARP